MRTSLTTTRATRAVTTRAHARGRSRGRAIVRPRASVELANVALEMTDETFTAAAAAVLGLGAGLGIPIFFVAQERRDKERLEEIRELNRATLKATGEQ